MIYRINKRDYTAMSFHVLLVNTFSSAREESHLKVTQVRHTQRALLARPVGGRKFVAFSLGDPGRGGKLSLAMALES